MPGNLFRTVMASFLPKDPVPPVIKTVLSHSISFHNQQNFRHSVAAAANVSNSEKLKFVINKICG
jgi:hypothetical protein